MPTWDHNLKRWTLCGTLDLHRFGSTRKKDALRQPTAPLEYPNMTVRKVLAMRSKTWRKASRMHLATFKGHSPKRLCALILKIVRKPINSL